ncbi:hypothetical protein FAF44_09005 [Nonomuraea sp. MG754425]|uniref:hypothetical protein n=1 Tax=Nonomuraea sp. MG754425 TaxID=2570319 RepID=UPI001F416BA7|nr:hypothetical protein [Nonomuraea sp. MG754425]MCF6468524.1 hypothetical protein [Nonomuraea sp. MG754425]
MALDLVQQERLEASGETWVTANAADLTDRELAQLDSLRVFANAADPKLSMPQFFRGIGAVDPGESFIKVVLRGARPEGVRITGMTAITECGPPLRGTLFYSPPAGEEASAPIGFDLDEPEPKAQRIPDEGDWEKDYFARRTISLAHNETIALRLETVTAEHYCEYTFQMQVATATGAVTQVIDNAGKPFAVSALLRNNAKGDLAFKDYQQLYVGGVGNPHGDDLGWNLWDAAKYERVYYGID